MKIRYDGVEYTQRRIQAGAAPLHIIELQAQSKRPEVRALLPDGEPLSLSVLTRWGREAQAYGAALGRWERARKDGTATDADQPDPPDCAVWLGVVNLYLTLRSGGWQGTLLDAAAIPDGDVRYIREVSDTLTDEPDDDGEDGEVATSADPTVPGSPGGPATSGSDASPDESPAAAEATGAVYEPLT